MALCYLLNQSYCKKSGNQITAFIIDHQLKAESTKEVFQVSNILSTLGKLGNEILLNYVNKINTILFFLFRN